MWFFVHIFHSIAIQYARYTHTLLRKITIVLVQWQKKKNRSNITVTIECTSFRQLTTNHIQIHVHIRTKPQKYTCRQQTHMWWIFQPILFAKRSNKCASFTSQYSFFFVVLHIELNESYSLFSLFITFLDFVLFFFVSKFSIFEFDLLKRRFDFYMCVPVLAIFFQFFETLKQYLECTKQRRRNTKQNIHNFKAINCQFVVC